MSFRHFSKKSKAPLKIRSATIYSRRERSNQNASFKTASILQRVNSELILTYYTYIAGIMCPHLRFRCTIVATQVVEKCVETVFQKSPVRILCTKTLLVWHFSQLRVNHLVNESISEDNLSFRQTTLSLG